MLTRRVVGRTKSNMVTSTLSTLLGKEGRCKAVICLLMTWNQVGQSLSGIVWSRKESEDWSEDEIKTQACVQEYIEGVM